MYHSRVGRLDCAGELAQPGAEWEGGMALTVEEDPERSYVATSGGCMSVEDLGNARCERAYWAVWNLR
jgi:hypothetical protein